MGLKQKRSRIGDAQHHREQVIKYLRQTDTDFVLNELTNIYELRRRPTESSASIRKLSKNGRPLGSWADWFSVLVSGFGVAVSLATAILLFVTAGFALWQLNEAHRAAEASLISATIAKDSLAESVSNDKQQALANERNQISNGEAARESSRQAAAALQATINNFNRDQRAWLGFQSIKIDGKERTFGIPVPRDRHRPYTFEIDGVSLELVNTGKTPATIDDFDARIYAGHQPWDTPQFYGAQYGGSIKLSVNGPKVIAPGQKSTAESQSLVIDGTVPRLPSIKVDGLVTYRDAQNVTHSTKLCIYTDVFHPTTYTFCPGAQDNYEN